jgi:hypothetical protein
LRFGVRARLGVGLRVRVRVRLRLRVADWVSVSRVPSVPTKARTPSMAACGMRCTRPGSSSGTPMTRQHVSMVP